MRAMHSAFIIDPSLPFAQLPLPFREYLQNEMSTNEEAWEVDTAESKTDLIRWYSEWLSNKERLDAMPHLYIQATNSAEYEKFEEYFKLAMNTIFNRDFSKKMKIEFDPVAMQIKIYHTHEELLENLDKDYRSVLPGSYQLKFQFRFQLQITERATPAIKLEFDHAMKILEMEKFTEELEKKAAVSPEIKGELIEESKIFHSQIVVVQDNHSVVTSKQWIINNIEKFESNKILIVEFSEDVDITTVKNKLVSMAFFNGGDDRKIVPKIREMIDKTLASGGEVIGGENTLSVNTLNRMAVMLHPTPDDPRVIARLKMMDAAFCGKVQRILAKDPKRQIILWAGNKHAQGLIRNILVIHPGISVATIYPGSGEPVYRYNAPTKIAAAAPSPAAPSRLK